MADNKHIGSTLDDFLKEEGCFDEFSAAAIKEVFAWQIAQGMKKKRLTKVEMADRMRTSRSQLDRLLDPKDGNVTLATMQKAAVAIGEQLNVGLVPQAGPRMMVAKVGGAGWKGKQHKTMGGGHISAASKTLKATSAKRRTAKRASAKSLPAKAGKVGDAAKR